MGCLYLLARISFGDSFEMKHATRFQNMLMSTDDSGVLLFGCLSEFERYIAWHEQDDETIVIVFNDFSCVGLSQANRIIAFDSIFEMFGVGIFESFKEAFSNGRK